jgi:hypothetical protein
LLICGFGLFMLHGSHGNQVVSLLLLLLFTGAYSPGRTFGLPFRGFLITHNYTHGRTPLDE